MGWIQKCDIDEEGVPVPTETVSNEEFEPPDQTEEHERVEQKINDITDKMSKS
jgi:hypothetical protein